jgi:hypothetical protein
MKAGAAAAILAGAVATLTLGTLAVLGSDELLPTECGCRADGGQCSVKLLDGGRGAAPFGLTVGNGYPLTEPRGDGCVRMPCTEGFGKSVWPAECPSE